MTAYVSILTRAIARVQRAGPWATGRSGRFQSSLELSPECNLGMDLKTPSMLVFQSSLELSPECNCAKALSPSYLSEFQSSLELSPECNKAGQTDLVVEVAGFQSSLELSPECNLAY